MNIVKTTTQYIGLSMAISVVLIGVVALMSYLGIAALVEYSLIFVTAGPLLAAMALSAPYAKSDASQPTWKELGILTAISFPILIGASILIITLSTYIMINLMFKDTLAPEFSGLGFAWIVSGRSLFNASMGLLLGILLIFPKQVALRRKTTTES